MLENAGYLALLALGFGFVVFWHELGHFLAAKWAGVKVEQFAVGFMQAIVSWRKGLGVRFGSSKKEFTARLEEWLRSENPERAARIAAAGASGSGTVTPANEPPVSERPVEIQSEWSDVEYARAAKALKIGETEYRLNWLPLGGYVKMLGQDDLRPNAEAEDPRAYNRQSIPKRMVIVSAGVVMNVLLAGIGFVILFMIGFHVAPAKVGVVVAGSPAQLARAADPKDNGVRVGDDAISLDGRPMYNDQTKFKLNAALSAAGEEIPFVVRRDGREIELKITPQKLGGMVALGIGDSFDLVGLKPDDAVMKAFNAPARTQLNDADMFLVAPGEAVVAVNGRHVEKTDYAIFDAAMQTGERVQLTVRTVDGKEDVRSFLPSFSPPFGEQSFNLIGFVPRIQIDGITEQSSAMGILQPGDVVTKIGARDGASSTTFPSFGAFKSAINAAAAVKKHVSMTVLRNGKLVDVTDLAPIKVAPGDYGLGVHAGFDDAEAVVADIVEGSPVAAAKMQNKSQIKSVDGQAVANWREFHLALRKAVVEKPTGATIKLAYKTEGGETRSVDVVLAAADVQAINQVRYASGVLLEPTVGVRKADGIGQAVSLGVIETRDFMLQFYVTLRRMVSGDVSPSNLMGPVGIFQAGTRFASKGTDWLIWFLAMISANLAVVNFLPIPVVDGGLFTFLIAEKIKGKPISQTTQNIAQWVGLTLLLGVFVFVTWQDIANFAFRMR